MPADYRYAHIMVCTSAPIVWKADAHWNVTQCVCNDKKSECEKKGFLFHFGNSSNILFILCNSYNVTLFYNKYTTAMSYEHGDSKERRMKGNAELL